ncbi:MAG: PAS domain S-box protein [Cytophagales bacterium]|nr:PAS domain S-box protein [Cytophagales bacterium]
MQEPIDDGLPIGLVYIREGNLSYFNVQFQQLTGIVPSSDSPLFESLIHPDSLAHYQSTLKHTPDRFDIPIKMANTEKWIRLSHKHNESFPPGLKLYLSEDVTESQLKDLLIKSITEEFTENDRSIFSTIVLKISDLLNVKYALIGIADDSMHKITTRALCHNHEILENFSYEIEGMPCGEVLTQGVFCLSDEISLKNNINNSAFGPDIESYIGIGLTNDQGETIGHFCLIDNKPIESMELVQSLLELFASRLSLELQKESQQKEIESSLEKYQSLFEYSVEAKFVYDSIQNKYLTVNQAAINLFGYSKEEFQSLTPFDLKPAQVFNESVDENINRSIEHVINHGFLREESLNMKSDGTVFETEITVSLLNQEKKHFLISFLDISDRKKAERGVIRSKERFRNLFQFAYEAKFVLDTSNNRILDANIAACTLFGYNKSQLLELTPFDLIPPDMDKADLAHSISRALEVISGEGNFTIGETQRLKSDGTVFDAEVALSSLEHDSKKILVSVRDISARKQVERQLTKYRDHLEDLVQSRTSEIKSLNLELQGTNSELEQSIARLSVQKKELENTLEELRRTQNQVIQAEKTAALGVFTMGVAHEMNNSLNLIHGAKNVINLELNHLNNIPQDVADEIGKALEWIEEGSDRATNIVKGLSAYAQQGADVRRSTTIDEILKSAISIFNGRLDNEMEIHSTYDANFPLEVYADRLHKVFINLLDNAIYFTQHRKKADLPKTIEVKSEINQVTKNVLVSFHNYGDKIDQQIIGKIFDPLFSTKEIGEGAGLGLTVAYSFVSQHNGSIEAHNQNDGVKMVISIPLEIQFHDSLQIQKET